MFRFRRLRQSSAMRDMVCETQLYPKDFIYPLFIIEGENIKESVESMPGVYRYSIDLMDEILEKIDKSVIEAAHDLGCNNVKTMFKVVVPLSMPGIMSGITMVFVPAISTFIISRMLGGGSNLLIGDLIEMQFLGNSYNPNLGAAISLVLMVIILLIMTILNQFDDDEDKVLM